MSDPIVPSTREHVVYVHGLWMSGAESFLLRRRLARSGFDLHAFRWKSTRSRIADVVEALHAHVGDRPTDRLHFVGHSLGGIVIHRLLEAFGDLPPGRVVLLGTPARGSRTAIAAARRGFGPWLGEPIGTELLHDHERRWPAGRELGVLAGTRRLGVGRLFGVLGDESDGTVGVDETRLDGTADHRTIRASHMGLLFSPEAARETAHFLVHGRFTGAP